MNGRLLAALSAWVAQPAWQDWQAHISHEQDTVALYHERPWPFNFAKAWLRHALPRTEQLVLDVHFAFLAGFVQISALQIKSLDVYLNGLGNTPLLLS